MQEETLQQTSVTRPMYEVVSKLLLPSNFLELFYDHLGGESPSSLVGYAEREAIRHFNHVFPASLFPRFGHVFGGYLRKRNDGAIIFSDYQNKPWGIVLFNADSYNVTRFGVVESVKRNITTDISVDDDVSYYFRSNGEWKRKTRLLSSPADIEVVALEKTGRLKDFRKLGKYERDFVITEDMLKRGNLRL